MSRRGRRIAAVFARQWAGALPAARFGLAAGPARRRAFARGTRLACEELGPAFVKLGQLASVRPDLFSAETVFELERLQDAIPPVPFEAIRTVLRQEFGREPEEVFATFSETPLASASIAQVHEATLREAVRPVWGPPLEGGAPVAVKVVRPGTAEAIAADLAVARGLVRRFGSVGPAKRADLSSLLDEFGASLGRELDLRNEARVADRFGFDFRDDPKVLVPRVAWPLTTRRVLTAERVDGWRLTELDRARREGVDARELALHGALAFMRQVLVLGRFHADLHPANLLVTPDSRIAYLDFGIVGTLDAEEREAIAQLLAALAYGDPERALAYSGRLGVEVVPAKRDAVLADLDALMRRTLAPGRADVRHFGMGFLGLLGRHGVPIPVGYGLLVKALVTVEGVSRALYPDIDVLETARPYATRLVAQALARPERLAERAPEAFRAALRELAR